MSSNLPYPAEACPLDLAAAKPPSVAYSYDWGKCPSVSPCAARSCSACGARRPGSSSAIMDTGSTETSRLSLARSSATTPHEAPPDRDEAADHRGAPAERHHGHPMLRAQAEHGGHLVVRAGEHDGVGRVRGVTRAHEQQVGGGLAPGVADSGVVVGPHVLVADDRGQRGQDGRRQHDRRQPHLAERRRMAWRAPGRRGVPRAGRAPARAARRPWRDHPSPTRAWVPPQ